MDEITIETGIELSLVSRNGRPAKYPWRSMKVGDSFFVAGRTAKSIGGSTSNARKTLGHSFVARTIIHEGQEGVRVWRTE